MLQHLDVSSCQINDIDDDAFGRLEILASLYLNDNNITRIPSSLPVNLIRLYLQNNRISDIQGVAFAHLINLEELNLSGNQLMYVPGLPLPRLLTLDLRVSGLKGLSQSVVKMSPQLKDIFLDGNPIKCTELLSLAEWATPCRTEKPIDSIDDVNGDDDVKNATYVDDMTVAAELFNPYQSLHRQLQRQRRRQCTCKLCELPSVSNRLDQHCSSSNNNKRLIDASNMLNNNVLMANGKQSLELVANVDKSLTEMSTNHVPNQMNSALKALEHETSVTLMASASSSSSSTATATAETNVPKTTVTTSTNGKMENNDGVRAIHSSTNETLIERKSKNFNNIGKQLSDIIHANEHSDAMPSSHSSANTNVKIEHFRMENDERPVNNDWNRSKTNANVTKSSISIDSTNGTIIESGNLANDGNSHSTNLSYAKETLADKVDRVRDTINVNETKNAAQSHGSRANADLAKGKKPKKPKQSTKQKSKQQSNKLNTSNKTSNNDDSNRTAYQQDDGQSIRTKQAIERLEATSSDNGQTSNPWIRASNDQLIQLYASNSDFSAHSLNNGETETSAANTRSGDKLGNLTVNSSAIYTNATQTPFDRSSDMLLPITASNGMAVDADGMETMTPTPTPKRLDDGNTTAKQNGRVKQTDQVANVINSGYKRDNSAINWNTNKAISKMNYTTSNEGMAMLASTLLTTTAQPLSAASSTNAMEMDGNDNNAGDSDKIESMERGQTIGDRKINDKVEKMAKATATTTTTTTATATTVNVITMATSTEKSHVNSLGLLHKEEFPAVSAMTMAPTAIMTNYSNGVGAGETADDAHIVDHQQQPNHHDYDDAMNNTEKLNKLTIDAKAMMMVSLTTDTKASAMPTTTLATMQTNSRLNEMATTTTTESVSLQQPAERTVQQEHTKNGTNVIAINEIRNNKYDKQEACCTELPATTIQRTNDNATLIRNNANAGPVAAVLQSLFDDKVNRRTNTLNASLLSLSGATSTTTTSTATVSIERMNNQQNQQRDDNRNKSDNNNSNTARNGKFMTIMQNRGKTNAINGIGYVPSIGSLKDMHQHHSDWSAHNAHGTNQTIGPLIYSVQRSHPQTSDQQHTQAKQNEANNHGTNNHNNVNAIEQPKQQINGIVGGEQTVAATAAAAAVVPSSITTNDENGDNHQLPTKAIAIEKVDRLGGNLAEQLVKSDIDIVSTEAIGVSGPMMFSDQLKRQPISNDEHHRTDNDQQQQQQQQHTNAGTSGGLSEQWYDLRNTAGHPGLLIVVGIAIGVLISLGLIHLYRCRKRNRPREYTLDDERFMCITQANRDLLPMELLNSSAPYTDAPIELW